GRRASTQAPSTSWPALARTPAQMSRAGSPTGTSANWPNSRLKSALWRRRLATSTAWRPLRGERLWSNGHVSYCGMCWCGCSADFPGRWKALPHINQNLSSPHRRLTTPRYPPSVARGLHREGDVMNDVVRGVGVVAVLALALAA